MNRQHNSSVIVITPVLGMLLLFFQHTSANSQDILKYPEIGNKCPAFKMKNVTGNVGKEISLQRLRGKHFILDFWTTGCIPCIGSFPEVNKLNNQFRDSLEIILVGLDEKKRDVHAFYKKFENKYNLELPCGIDSNVFKRFVHGTVPFSIWVDRNGIIKAITRGDAILAKNIKKFISDDAFEFVNASHSGALNKVNKINTSSIGTNKINSPIMESRIEKWRPGSTNATTIKIDEKKIKNGVFNLGKMDLTGLYTIAFFGDRNYIQNNFYPIPILSIRDSTLFKYHYDNTAEDKFNYTLILPNRELTRDSIMSIMQSDLRRAFPFKVSLIKANMPCMELIVTDRYKLEVAIERSKTKNLGFQWRIESISNKFSNYQIKNLASLFSQYMPFPLKNRSYDTTGMEETITMEFPGHIDSLENIRAQLSKVGLDYVPTTRLTQVLHITD